MLKKNPNHPNLVVTKHNYIKNKDVNLGGAFETVRG